MPLIRLSFSGKRLSVGLLDDKLRNSVITGYVLQAATVAMGFIFMTIVTRSAGINVYGQIVLLAALGTVFNNLVTFRTNEAVTKYYKSGKTTGDLGLCRLALTIGLAFDLIVMAVTALLAQVYAPTIATLLLKQAVLAHEVLIYAFVTISTMSRGAAIGVLTAEERFKLINILTLAEQVIKVMLLTLFFFEVKTLELNVLSEPDQLASYQNACTKFVSHALQEERFFFTNCSRYSIEQMS